MASVANAQLGRELASIVGDEFVCDTAAPLTGYAIDGVRPATWVIPQNANEVAAIVRVANERRASIAVAGGFTKQSMGGVPAQIDILLRTDRLNRVLHYDPGDLTIGVESGCRIGDVVSRVGQDSLVLPLDVPRSQQAACRRYAAGTRTPRHSPGGAPMELRRSFYCLRSRCRSGSPLRSE